MTSNMEGYKPCEVCLRIGRRRQSRHLEFAEPYLLRSGFQISPINRRIVRRCNAQQVGVREPRSFWKFIFSCCSAFCSFNVKFLRAGCKCFGPRDYDVHKNICRSHIIERFQCPILHLRDVSKANFELAYRGQYACVVHGEVRGSFFGRLYVTEHLSQMAKVANVISWCFRIVGPDEQSIIVEPPLVLAPPTHVQKALYGQVDVKFIRGKLGINERRVRASCGLLGILGKLLLLVELNIGKAYKSDHTYCRSNTANQSTSAGEKVPHIGASPGQRNQNARECSADRPQLVFWWDHVWGLVTFVQREKSSDIQGDRTTVLSRHSWTTALLSCIAEIAKNGVRFSSSARRSYA